MRQPDKAGFWTNGEITIETYWIYPDDDVPPALVYVVKEGFLVPRSSYIELLLEDDWRQI